MPTDCLAEVRDRKSGPLRKPLCHCPHGAVGGVLRGPEGPGRPPVPPPTMSDSGFQVGTVLESARVQTSDIRSGKAALCR